MAELIDKGAMLDDMQKELEKAVEDENMTEFDCKVLMTSALALKGFVNRQPTTTESEIRAKAIDEFAEKMGRLCENNAMALDRYNGRPLYSKDGKWHDLINEIAEHLKERE